MVFILPMRDWNSATGLFQTIMVKVFILPMRDWNLEEKRIKGYQEGGFLFYLWGIETADAQNGGVSIAVVFILPMRDWNYKNLLKSKQLKQVFILPMRDWNAFKSAFVEKLAQVFILPMRDWNHYRHI